MKKILLITALLTLLSAGCNKLNNVAPNADQDWKRYTARLRSGQFSFNYPATFVIRENPQQNTIQLNNAGINKYTIDIAAYDREVTADYLKGEFNGFKTINIKEFILQGHKAFRITGQRENNIQDAPRYTDYYDEDIVIVQNGNRYIRLFPTFNYLDQNYQTDHLEITKIVESFDFNN